MAKIPNKILLYWQISALLSQDAKSFLLQQKETNAETQSQILCAVGPWNTHTSLILFIKSTMFKGLRDFLEDDTESKTRVNRDTKKPLPSKSP